MAPSFLARSISFPLSPSRSTKPRAAAPPRHRARSVSLPCRSHPILGHLHAHIRAVRSWAHDHPAASLSAGLAHLAALHAALADLLHLPEAQAALDAACRANGDRLLDAFLRLADAHGCFQDAIVALKQHVADALAAVRRQDASRLASALRSQRKAAKELARLAAAAAREASARPSPSSRLGLGGAAEVEVASLLMEAAGATAAASAALFSAVAGMSASASAEACSCKRTAALVCLMKVVSAATSEEEQETAALAERLEEMEECIEEVEKGSDTVFRSLVQTRVALLNIRTNIF